jgi:phage major head subunit gpT-like protein
MLINGQVLAGLYRSFNAIFKNAFTQAETYWDKVATRVPSTTKANDYAWIGKFPRLREWVGERNVQKLAAHSYSIKNKSFESTVAVDRDDIEDDQLGIYNPMIQEMGQSAKEHPDFLIFDLLKKGFETQCYDGQYFFDADHPVGEESVSNFGGGAGKAWFLLDTTRALKPLIFQERKKPEFVSLTKVTDTNVFMNKEYVYGVDYRGNVGYGFWQMAYGSKQDLTAENYQAARAAMMEFKDEEGSPLNVKPNLLVVPPSLEGAAKEILEAERNAQGATNPWRNTAEILVVPYLA